LTRLSWEKDRVAVLDVFLIANLAFLTVDIWIAHSVNSFARWEEWIPFAFSLISPLLLTAALLRRPPANRLVLAVGSASILVGLAGLLFHLQSQFFGRFTIKSLVYTAPFAAPLAYSGIGFLIMMNRWVSNDRPDWNRWVLFFAAGGFLGNFVLTLCDHAQNGFFYWSEWIPVCAGAAAAGFLISAFLSVRLPDRFKRWCWGVLFVQFVVGIAGFFFHLYGNFLNPMTNWWGKIVYGAPIFAPLLFPNLALLAAIGLWDFPRADADN